MLCNRSSITFSASSAAYYYSISANTVLVGICARRSSSAAAWALSLCLICPNLTAGKLTWSPSRSHFYHRSFSVSRVHLCLCTAKEMSSPSYLYHRTLLLYAIGHYRSKMPSVASLIPMNSSPSLTSLALTNTLNRWLWTFLTNRYTHIAQIKSLGRTVFSRLANRPTVISQSLFVLQIVVFVFEAKIAAAKQATLSLNNSFEYWAHHLPRDTLKTHIHIHFHTGNGEPFEKKKERPPRITKLSRVLIMASSLFACQFSVCCTFVSSNAAELCSNLAPNWRPLWVTKERPPCFDLHWKAQYICVECQ